MITNNDIKNLPQAPGVYYFRDDKGKILYVGKAKRIRDRVKQHLMARYDGLKRDLITRAATITYEVTETPLEAIIREGEAIKREQPPFNVLWKDDKNFFFIGVSHEDDPEIFLTHQPDVIGKEQGLRLRGSYRFGQMVSLDVEPKRQTIRAAKPKPSNVTFFGPFVEKAPVAEIMRALRIIFGPPSDRFGRGRGVRRGRLVRRAKGWRIYEANWRDVVRELRIFFKKGVRGLRRETENAMAQAAAGEDFERATYFRDKIWRLERFLQAQLVARAVAQEGREAHALQALQHILKLSTLPRHIEGYDISNIQGTLAVASLVTARDGIMITNEYKRFKIKTVRGANDVAMIREVLTRRLKHAAKDARIHWGLPDLFLIDGGKPQVHAAVETLERAGIDRPIVGLAKRDERLVLWRDGAWEEIHLDKANTGLQMLQRVRDESHRFARNYFRTLQRKKFRV